MNGYALIALISRLRRSIAVVAVLAVIASIGGVLGLTSSASAAAVAFSNSTAISIADAGVCSPIPCTPTPGTGTPYPSNIAVSGVAGTIASLTVVLHNVTHPATNDIDVLLVGPGGQKFVLVSDAGGGCPTCTASNASVTFDDAAASTLGTTGGWPTGTFRPSNEGTSADGFPSPAPAAPYSSPAPTGSATLGTTFNGTDPNGTWSLYAVDDLNGGTGSFAGGWTLNITPASAAPTTTSVTSSTNPSRTGNSVTLSAHVIRQSDSSNVTTSTVTFKEGSTTLASNVALSASGIAAFSTASLTEGSHVITAFYNGDATFAQSNGSVTQVVDNNTTVSAGSYCNTGVLTLNDSLVSATATPYPSHVFVSSLAGAISKVTLTAKGVTEPFASDLDLLLVGPSGQKFVIVSDAGGPVAISNATVTFDDDAVSQFVQASGGWSSGSTRPVDYNTGTDTFPSPAPASPLSPVPTGTATLASVFGGIDPNGTWSLYAVDDSLSSGSGGSIANGWCLNFTTSNDPATTTTVTSSTNPSSAGSSVTFAAHVTKTSDSSNVTTGTVTFRSDGIVIGAPTALSGAGTASTTTSALSEGTHTITASYSGSPGNFNLSTGSMSQQVDSSTVVSGTTYCNNGGIQVNDPASNGVIGTATPYPSHIVVSGTSGNLLKLTATIKGITHTSPDDLDILLVSPTGTTLKLMSDTGGLTAISGVNLTLDDAAASSLPDSTAISAGTFKPTDYVAGDTFPSPAPAGPYGSPAPVGAATLASFAGGSPNGTWSLYVADDGLGDPGSVSGWCLNLTLPPVANDDAYNAAQDTTLTVPAPGVLANDTGTPAPTAVAIAGGPTTQGGTVTLSTNGGFTYAPPSGFTGTDTFTYTATNGPGATDTATVTITVTHKPAITGATVARQQGSPAANDTIATVSDVETPNGNLTVTASPPAGISVSNITNTAGTVTADVAATCAATTGPNSVPLTVTDGDSLTNTANLTVNVSANTAPTLAYGASGLAVNAGGTGAVDPSSGPSDNGSIASLTVQNVPAAFTGTVTIDGPASATPGRVHIGTAGPAGDYTITLRTTDNCGLVTDASLALTVNGAPTVDAGSAQTVGIATGATLAGSVTDDGRAPGNSTPTALWSKDSGPGTVTFADASSPTTHADFSVAGVYVLRLTGDDGQLTSSDTVQITVGSAPVIHVPADITVTEASPGAGSAVSFTVTADGFPTPTIACAEGATPVSSGSTFAAGVHTIDCTATNAVGSDSGSFTITVRSVPVITVPADITVTETTPGAGASVPFTVTATGTPTPTIACAEGATPVSSGSTFAAGVHTIDCTATNAVGSDSGSFTITVRSVPVITVPADITVTETTPGAGASVPFTVTATGTPTPSITCFEGVNPVSSGSVFAAGVHTVDCTATNGVGSDSGSFTITVRSVPVITVPADFTVVENPQGSGTASVPFTVTATGVPTPTIGCAIGATPVTSPVTLAIGSHTIDCTATNAVGSDSDSFTVTVIPANHPPVPDAGGPYSAAEGGSLTLNGNGTTDADGDALTYSWDVNGDGTFGDATGVHPTLTWTQLKALGINDGPATFSVKVRVSDGHVGGTVDSSAATLTVTNTAPVAALSGPSDVNLGSSLTLALSATDQSPVDQAAGFDYTVAWGDGVTTGPVHGGSPLNSNHAYTAAGVYTVSMTATDKDGGTSAAVTKTITVGGTSIVPGTCGSGTDLVVGGTSAGDTIKVVPGTSSGSLKVTVNNVLKGTFTPTGRLVIYGQGGNDTITIDTRISTPRIVYGGAGNDSISGGNGDGIQLGGDGNDTLTAGNGRDILIGGAGADILNGVNGDDIVIAGSTTYDPVSAANQVSLCAIAKEWNSGSSYTTRIFHLTGAMAGGLNGSSKLTTTGAGRTVLDDTSKDTLTGGLGLDWFLLNRSGGTVLDTSDATSAEIATDLQ